MMSGWIAAFTFTVVPLALAACAVRARRRGRGTTHHDPYAEPAGDVPRLPAKGDA